MIPSNIVVGQKYSHKNYPEVTYLGCCSDDDKNDKYLIISGIPNPPKDNYTIIGNKVKFGGQSWWDGFYLKKN